MAQRRPAVPHDAFPKTLCALTGQFVGRAATGLSMGHEGGDHPPKSVMTTLGAGASAGGRTCGCICNPYDTTGGSEYGEGLGGRAHAKRPVSNHTDLIVCLWHPIHGLRGPVGTPVRERVPRRGPPCVRQGAACSRPRCSGACPVASGPVSVSPSAGGLASFYLADLQTLCHRGDEPVGAVPRSLDRDLPAEPGSNVATGRGDIGSPSSAALRDGRAGTAVGSRR